MGSSYKHGDYYNRKARAAGAPARSVYKLEELDQRFSLLRPGQRVLELGAAPGSWSQYAARRIGPQGRLWAYDLAPLTIALPAQASFVQADVLATALEDFPNALALVLSDMAPATSGDRFGDAAHSHRLAERVLEIALARLEPGGAALCKVFEGEDTPALLGRFRQSFATVKQVRPRATRSMSREIFIVATSRKDPNDAVHA